MYLNLAQLSTRSLQRGPEKCASKINKTRFEVIEKQAHKKEERNAEKPMLPGEYSSQNSTTTKII